jgi:hypothetical protein
VLRRQRNKADPYYVQRALDLVERVVWRRVILRPWPVVDRLLARALISDRFRTAWIAFGVLVLLLLYALRLT